MGNTNLTVCEIGLGGEWLNGLDKDLVKEIIHKAIDGGITFFDFLFNELNYIKNISNAIKGQRDKIILQTHLGTGEKDGKPKRDRNVKHNEKLFERTLSCLETDYIDIINIQFVREKEFEAIIGKGGLLDLARKLKKEEKVGFIGVSTHNVSIGKKLIDGGFIDSIMFPINIANHYLKEREELLELCEDKGIGLIAIKPFVCGKLFESNHTVYLAKYQTGGLSMRKKIPKNILPSQCLNYCLSQRGISTVIPGVKSIYELEQILLYYQTEELQRDFIPIFEKYHKKEYQQK